MRISTRMAALAAAILFCAMPSLGKGRDARKVEDASPEGLARLVRRIEENAGRIRRTSFLFRAPGYPRDDMLRAALVRENADLLHRAELAARALLSPIRKDPPPGKVAWLQLLRDTESGAHSARLLDDYNFRDATIAQRFAARARTAGEAPPSGSGTEPSGAADRKSR